MEVFYEESAIAGNARKGAKKYGVYTFCSYFFLILSILAAIITFLYVPIKGNSGGLIMALATIFLFVGFWLFFNRLRFNTNLSYDYCFVSGELRISKVVNVNKRRLMVKLDVQNILQIGDADSPAFERLFTDPSSKNVVCTSNDEPATGKFFMYILIEHEGKKLFVLECREALLMNIMKFAKRSVLDHDYVMQDKKQQGV